jgi:hypothetical protein
MRFLTLFVALVLTICAFHVLDIPYVLLFYIIFLGVPVVTLVKISRVDLSEYDTDTWKPKKIKKRY